MNYSEKKLLSAQVKFWSIVFVLLLFGLGALLWSVPKMSESLKALGVEKFVFGIAMFLVGFFCHWVFNKCGDDLEAFLEKLDKTILSFGKGIKGELLFEEVLKKYLTSTSKLIHSIDTGYGDVDFLLVDERGVFVFEVKNYKGKMYIEDEFVWRVYNSGDKLIKDSKSPCMQALNSKNYVINKLSSAALNIFSVTTVLAFVDDEVELKAQPKHVWVCNGKKNLDKSLTSLLNRPEVLTEKEIKRISELFHN